MMNYCLIQPRNIPTGVGDDSGTRMMGDASISFKPLNVFIQFEKPH